MKKNVNMEEKKKWYPMNYVAYLKGEKVATGKVNVELDECTYLIIAFNTDENDELYMYTLADNVYGYIDEDIEKNHPELNIDELEYKVKIGNAVPAKAIQNGTGDVCPNLKANTDNHMKALAIRQPWATLIAYGIKDVECRSNMRPSTKRFLIAASSVKEDYSIFSAEERKVVESYIAKGILPPYSQWPTGCIIGYADIERVTYDPVESLWAKEWDGIKYCLTNAHLLDEPITGKNKATPYFYNVEGYDDEHLPAAHKVKLD